MCPHLVTLVACITFVGCAAPAASPPAAPISQQHPSAAEEQDIGVTEEQAADVLDRHAALEGDSAKCGPIAESQPGEICWGAPTESGGAAEDRLRATELRTAAVRHRQISAELRDAEARACAGLAETDIDESPFAHRADIVAVDVVHGPPGPDGSPTVLGARVRFHHVGGLTSASLQHIVDCHIARDNALGNDVPEMSYDPLVPPGATATVIDVPHGYVIDVRSNDPAAAREIAQRALALIR